MSNSLTTLNELELEEVSVVDVPANKKKIAMTKMDDDFVINVIKNTALEDAEKTYDMLKELPEKVQEAMKAMLKIKEAMGNDLPMDRVMQMMGYDKMDHDKKDYDKMDHDDTEKMDCDEMEKGMDKEDDKEMEKADSVTKSALEDVKKQNADLIKLLKQERETRIKAEWVQKSLNSLEGLPDTPENLASMLFEISKADLKLANKTFTVLQKCQALVSKSELIAKNTKTPDQAPPQMPTSSIKEMIDKSSNMDAEAYKRYLQMERELGY